MREGQAPLIAPSLVIRLMREPNMPRNTGSPLVPPLRKVAKPGMVFR